MGSYATRPRPDYPAQAVEDLAQVVFALRGVFAHQRQVGLDEQPFFVGDITGVGSAGQAVDPVIEWSAGLLVPHE